MRIIWGGAMISITCTFKEMRETGFVDAECDNCKNEFNFHLTDTEAG